MIWLCPNITCMHFNVSNLSLIIMKKCCWNGIVKLTTILASSSFHKILYILPYVINITKCKILGWYFRNWNAIRSNIVHTIHVNGRHTEIDNKKKSGVMIKDKKKVFFHNNVSTHVNLPQLTFLWLQKK